MLEDVSLQSQQQRSVNRGTDVYANLNLTKKCLFSASAYKSFSFSKVLSRPTASRNSQRWQWVDGLRVVGQIGHRWSTGYMGQKVLSYDPWAITLLKLRIQSFNVWNFKFSFVDIYFQCTGNTFASTVLCGTNLVLLITRRVGRNFVIGSQCIYLIANDPGTWVMGQKFNGSQGVMDHFEWPIAISELVAIGPCYILIFSWISFFVIAIDWSFACSVYSSRLDIGEVTILGWNSNFLGNSILLAKISK